MNKDISALYDVVNTIDEYISGNGSPGVEPKQAVTNYITHLEIMLTIPKIISQITLEQRSVIEAGINRGKAFIS